MYYVKEHNALFNSPEVKEPTKKNLKDIGKDTLESMCYDMVELPAYQQWRSSETKIIGSHSFEEGVDYQENVHYRVEYQIAKVGSNDFKTVHYGEYKNPMFTNKRTVAIPIKEDEEKDLEGRGFTISPASNQSSGPVASHSSTVGNSIQKINILTLLNLKNNKGWRFGQSLFNATHTLFPNIADKIRGTNDDCYYLDYKAHDFLEAVESLLNKQQDDSNNVADNKTS
jgi:hypothetical protein